MKRLLWAVVISCACASLSNAMPGEGVSRSTAESWGCDWDTYQEDLARAKANLPPGKVYTPYDGEHICSILARVGAPRDVDSTSGYGSTTYSLWYGDGEYEDMKLITLNGATMRAEYISW